ncbi:MAG: Ldh family oxidoreductase [Pirellulales bacterium]|nr:Ldh family oxidoreductase [Pirellulales bacterium]
MPQVWFNSQNVRHNVLQAFCEKLFTKAGLRCSDAELVSNMLVESNLRGIDSHGVARLPHYLSRIVAGGINPRPQMILENLGPSTARINGNRGLGQVVMNRATEESISLAQATGAGWVAVADSSHCGALAHYGLKIADAGMIGFVFTHVDSMVLPFGSRKPFCGTNPICITAPRSPSNAAGGTNKTDGALCLDMATSKVPWNTVANAEIEQVPIESGWGVDANGEDTTDAAVVESLYPVGSYKGSGLGLMIDVLCAMLSGSPFGPDIPKMYGDLKQPRKLGGLVGAIDISRFVPLEQFHERVAELIERWGALPPLEPGGRVLFPGEPELITRQKRLRDGIPLGLRTLEEFKALAETYGLEHSLRELISTIPSPVASQAWPISDEARA